MHSIGQKILRIFSFYSVMFTFLNQNKSINSNSYYIKLCKSYKCFFIFLENTTTLPVLLLAKQEVTNGFLFTIVTVVFCLSCLFLYLPSTPILVFYNITINTKITCCFSMGNRGIAHYITRNYLK